MISSSFFTIIVRQGFVDGHEIERVTDWRTVTYDHLHVGGVELDMQAVGAGKLIVRQIKGFGALDKVRPRRVVVTIQHDPDHHTVIRLDHHTHYLTSRTLTMRVVTLSLSSTHFRLCR